MVLGDAESAGAREQPVEIVAFAEFYDAQYRPAVRLAVAMLGRWDLAEEIVQDAFVALHARWDRVSRYESPEGWLRRVVLNRSLSALRRRSVELRLLGRLARQRERAPDVIVPDTDLWRAVAALPKRQAQVVALMFVDDLSVGEVAAVLECDESTVRTHFRRARRHLAAQLGLEEEAG